MRWRDVYPSFFDELEKIELEKQAIAPLVAGAMGLASHLGSNLLVRATHNTATAKALRARLLAQGIHGGISGKPQSLINRIGQVYTSPEVFAPEHAGRLLGSELSTLRKGRQIRALKKLRKM